MNDIPGITSYKHLDIVLGDVVKNSNNGITASQINTYICEHFKIGKIKLSPKSIGKRLTGRPDIRADLNQKRINVYTYVDINV